MNNNSARNVLVVLASILYALYFFNLTLFIMCTNFISELEYEDSDAINENINNEEKVEENYKIIVFDENFSIQMPSKFVKYTDNIDDDNTHEYTYVSSNIELTKVDTINVYYDLDVKFDSIEELFSFYKEYYMDNVNTSVTLEKVGIYSVIHLFYYNIEEEKAIDDYIFFQNNVRIIVYLIYYPENYDKNISDNIISTIQINDFVDESSYGKI